MTDELCGVDPARLAKAASALEHLRDVLAANVPTIMNTMNEYGSPVSITRLRQAQARSVIDAAEMRARSNLAQKVLQQDARIHLDASTVTIAWDGAAVNAASARVDAQLLSQAEHDPNSYQAMADIQAVADNIQDHIDQGDKAYLSDFYNQAGPQVADLATVLHDLNGSANQPMTLALQHVFTSQDEQIMHTFAAGLAYVDSSGLLRPTTVKQLTAVPTLWSMSMLVRYGPPGSAYGTQDPKAGSENFLAQLTSATFNAYQNGTLQVPLGTKYPPAYSDYEQINQDLSDYDPLSALLQADAQNKTAAMQLLGTPDGSKLASFLLNYRGVRYAYDASGEPPGKDFTILGPNESVNFPDEIYQVQLSQPAVGAFLDAATAAPRGDNLAAHQSAQAAYNIISQTPAPLIEGGSVVWQVSAPVRQALLATFGRYMPDLAYSTDGLPTPPVEQINGPGTPWAISVNSSQLNAFLREVAVDKKDFTAMEAMSGLAMGTSIGLVAENKSIPGMSADPARDFASLYARISTEAANVGITEGQQKDLLDQQLNQMISLAEAGFGVIPGGGEVLAGAKALAAVSAPFVPQFSTGNEAAAVAAAQAQGGTAELLSVIPLVRGLASTGVPLKHPVPADAFDANGNPTPALGQWWRLYSNQVVDGKSIADWQGAIQEAMSVQNTAFLES